jgi:Cysteine rich repeat
MKARSCSLSVTICAVALALGGASPAQAETDIAKKAIAKAEAAMAKVEAACEEDFEKYCKSVTHGEGRIALCMMAHEDKITDACFEALLSVADGIDLAVSNLERAADACAGDIDKLCASIEPGEGRIVQCLIDNKPALSTQCGGEIAGLEARMRK